MRKRLRGGSALEFDSIRRRVNEEIVERPSRRTGFFIVVAVYAICKNKYNLALALELSAFRSQIRVETLAYDDLWQVPLKLDLDKIDESEVTILQDEQSLDPPFTNMRVHDYRTHIREMGFTPTRIEPDVTAFTKMCPATP
jgi:hypothetical protein